MLRTVFFAAMFLFFAFSAAAQTPGIANPPAQTLEIPNPLIDSKGFMRDTKEAFARRKMRRVTEKRFLEMAKDQGTVILDTRSAKKFGKMHVAGATHLNFSDMTKESLAQLIPSIDTRILIYCNNNFKNEPAAFPSKSITAPLNLPTFITLHSYGYKNVYELGPLLDPKTSKLFFEGSIVSR